MKDLGYERSGSTFELVGELVRIREWVVRIDQREAN